MAAEETTNPVTEIKVVPDEKKRINPMKVIEPKAGKAYILDFSRESIKHAEDRKFKFGEVTDYVAGGLPDLFYYAFRKNHKSMTRPETDAILEDLGGLMDAEIVRLIDLYRQALDTLIIPKDDIARVRKNSTRIVEL